MERLHLCRQQESFTVLCGFEYLHQYNQTHKSATIQSLMHKSAAVSAKHRQRSTQHLDYLHSNTSNNIFHDVDLSKFKHVFSLQQDERQWFNVWENSAAHISFFMINAKKHSMIGLRPVVRFISIKIWGEQSSNSHNKRGQSSDSFITSDLIWFTK